MGRYKGGGAFTFSPASQVANLYSTCFAVLALDLVRALPELSAGVREEVIESIRSLQDPETGLFIDSRLGPTSASGHDRSYVEHQQTDFAILALDALGSEPRHRLRFVDDIERVGMDTWLSRMDWRDPWLASNRVMFVLNFLLFEDERGRPGARSHAERILDWLDSRQDPQNGLWNIGNRVSLVNQMAAAYHFLFFYTFLGRQTQHQDRIIDACLRLQDSDGLFTYAGGGGSCEDLDAVDLLTRCWLSTQYKTGAVRRSLLRAHRALWSNQNPDGGFCWAKRDRLSLGKALHVVRPSLLRVSFSEFRDNARDKYNNQLAVLLRPKSLTWAYSGLESMRIPLASSDLWSTWFRLLAIAMIEETLDDEKVGRTLDWNMRTKPGLGFYR